MDSPPDLEVLAERLRVLVDRPPTAELWDVLRQIEEVVQRDLEPASLDLAEALSIVGGVFLKFDRFAEAADRYRQVLAIRDHIDPEDPGSLETVGALALLLTESGQLDEALIHMRRAREMKRRSGDEPDGELLGILRALALTEERLLHFDAAAAAYRELVETSRRLLGPTHPETAGYLIDFADLLCQSADTLDEAERLLGEALEILRQSGSSDDLRAAAAFTALGLVRYVRGDGAGAIPLLERALQINLRLRPETDPFVARAYNNLGSAHTLSGNLATAEPLLLHAEELIGAASEAAPLDKGMIWSNLNELYRNTGRFDEAERYARLALDHFTAGFGRNHPKTATALNNLAMVYELQGDAQRAMPLLEEVVAILKTHAPYARAERIAFMNNLGVLNMDRGRFREAVAWFEEALEEGRRRLGDHPIVATTLDNLSEIHRIRGDTERAMSCAREALELRRTTQGEQHPDYAVSLSNVAKTLYSMDRNAEAEQYFNQALELERTTLGTRHPRYAMDLSALAVAIAETGRFDEGAKLHHQALQIVRETLGDHHPSYAAIIGALSFLERDRGRLSAAIELAREAIERDSYALGEDHPKISVSLHHLASLLAERGEYAEAEPLEARALEIVRKTFENHPGYGNLLQEHADIHQAMGKVRSAERLLLEALEIEQKTVGDNHPFVATVLSKLAEVYTAAGKYREAVAMGDRALEILRRNNRDAQPQFARALTSLALAYASQAQYGAAGESLRRAIEINVATGREGHSDHAAALVKLGRVYMETGRHADAEELYLEALERLRGNFGEGHPRVAKCLADLAALRASEGNAAEAERLLATARDVLSRTLGEHAPDFAEILIKLASHHAEMGAFASARRFIERALAIGYASLGGTHPLIAAALTTLATIHLYERDTAAAEPLFHDALELQKQLFGTQHPHIARTLIGLAEICLRTNRLTEAERHCRQSLSIARAIFPEQHPEVARALSNLGIVHQRRGDFAEAERVQRQAHEIWRACFGDEHATLLTSGSRLAVLAVAQGRIDEAFDFVTRREAIGGLLLRRLVPAMGEQRLAAWLATMRWTLEETLSLVVRHLAGSPVAVRFAFDLLLRRKAIGFEVLALQRAARGRDADADAGVQRLTNLRRLLADESLAGPAADGVDAHRQKLAQLSAAVEEVEQQLAARFPMLGLDQRMRDVGHEAVARALGPEAALIDIIRFDLFDFTAIAPRPPWQSARYAAFVATGGDSAAVQLLDLGDAATIDRKIDRFRRWLSSKSRASDRESDGTALREIVFDPLRQALGGRTRLVISPDGAFHRFPFETLPDTRAGHLLDAFAIGYVGSGRDLLAVPHTLAPSTSPLVAAAPDFDLQQANGAPEIVRFQPLPGTEAEGIEVAAILGVEPLLGAAVLKTAIESRRGPRIIHIATHGFFEADPRPLKTTGLMFESGELARGGPDATMFKATPDDPLLRSGLALAGANRGLRGQPLPAAAGNGLLLAADVLSLDLAGTELVVLSACETGLGDIREHEGVIGLRRMFLLAGAGTVVTSLWRVADAQTRQLMTLFYKAIAAAATPEAALRSAQIELRREWPHPYYWGAFVVHL